MSSDPKVTTQPFDGETNSGHTPGAAEGVDQSEGEDQSEREPVEGTSSTEPVEG